MTNWNTIPQNPIWQYDSDPPDPGGTQTALWQTGTNGIRTTSRGTEIYMNVQHRTLHAGRASVPSEMSKSFWDAQGILLPARPQTNYSASGLQINWDADNRGASIIKSGALSQNKSVKLFHSSDVGDNGGTYGAGNYKVSFNVTQNSGTDIDTVTLIGSTPSGPTTKPLYLSFRDDDTDQESPQHKNKGFLAITKGFNSFDIELFDDLDTQKPAIALVLHKNASDYNIDISDIHVVYVG